MKRGKSLTLGNLIVWLKKIISKLEKLNFTTATHGDKLQEIKAKVSREAFLLTAM